MDISRSNQIKRTLNKHQHQISKSMSRIQGRHSVAKYSRKMSKSDRRYMYLLVVGRSVLYYSTFTSYITSNLLFSFLFIRNTLCIQFRQFNMIQFNSFHSSRNSIRKIASARCSSASQLTAKETMTIYPFPGRIRMSYEASYGGLLPGRLFFRCNSPLCSYCK